MITAPYFFPPRLSASCSAKLIACWLQFVFSNLIFQPNFRLETLEFCSFALLAEQQLQSLQPRRRHTFPDIPSCCFCNNTVLGRKVFRHRESDLKSQITLSNIWGKYVSCIRQTQANANVFILYLLLTWKKKWQNLMLACSVLSLDVCGKGHFLAETFSFDLNRGVAQSCITAF